MPKRSSDTLVLLINSMTVSEKRSFRIYAERNKSSEHAKFMQLFLYISKEKSCEEAVVLAKMPALKKEQFSNLKANLFKQILSCLRLLERNKILEIQVREQVDFATILYSKGMYRACLEMLEKAKKKSIETNYESLTLSILEIEKRIESQHITGSMSPKAKKLSKQSNALMGQIAITNQLSNASLLLYGRYLEHGYVKSDREYEDLKLFFENLIPKVDTLHLEFYQKLYLYQSYVWFHNMSQAFFNCYKYAKKWVNLYEENPSLKMTVTTPYLKGMHNLLNALFMANKRNKFNEEYAQLLSFEIDKNACFNDVSLYHLFKWTHFLNKIFINAQYEESRELEELEQLLVKNRYRWDLHRMLIFHYKLGCVYFGIGNLKKSIDHLNIICDHNYHDFRKDIQSFARILNLIAHFDMGNEQLVSYRVRSLFRFLAGIDELEMAQRQILDFVRRTPRIDPSNLNKEFKMLKNKLLLIEQRPYEKRPFLYLDIISWLESKISGVEIKRVIQQKQAYRPQKMRHKFM